MSKQFDILSIGECLVEFTREEGDRYIQSFAGDVYNTLFYGSRLGLKTKFLSCFGGDQFTNGIIKLSAEENIDVSSCKILQDRVNGLYSVDKDENGRPLFSFWRKNSAATQTLKENSTELIVENILQSKVVLMSFIPFAVLNKAEYIPPILKGVKGKTLIYIDTNIRRSLWENPDEAREWVRKLSTHTDILSVSSGDHSFLFPDTDPIEHYSSLGYRKIIYRDEVNPVKYLCDSIEGEVPTFKATDIVDMTGAGDAFNAGCIFGITNNFAIEDAIRLGNASAAVALTGRGGMEKNYSRSEVEKHFGTL
jgi:2-dehydro-3-deoxygluconokinase